MKKWALRGGCVASLALVAALAGWGVRSARQDVPRDNDRIHVEERSPDGALTAFLIVREADSLSSDRLKVFVAPAGRGWHEGEMLMIGKRFGRIEQFDWVAPDRLCLLASGGDIEELEERARIGARQIEFRVAPDVDACDRALEQPSPAR